MSLFKSKEEIEEERGGEENITTKETGIERKIWMFVIIAVIIVALVILFIFFKKYTKYKMWKKHTLLG